MTDLSHSHLIVHRRRKRLLEQHRDELEAHRAKGGPFAAAVEKLLADHEEVESWLAQNSRSAATPSTGLSAEK